MQTQYFSRQNRNSSQANVHCNQLFLPISKNLSRSLHFSYVAQSKTHRDFTSKNSELHKCPENGILTDRAQHKQKQPKTTRNSLYPILNHQSFTNYLDTQIKPTPKTKNYRSRSNYIPSQEQFIFREPKRSSHEISSKTNDKYEKAYRRGLIQDTKRAVLQFNQDNLLLLNDIKRLRNQVSRRASPTKSPLAKTRHVTPTKKHTINTISTDYSQNSVTLLKFQTISAKLKDCQQIQSPKQNQKRFSFTDENFLILKQIGVGNFANVFLAVDNRSGFLVTLKKIKKTILKNKKCQDQLLTEIKIQLFANHPNILKIYGCYANEETLTLILEFMEEGNLYQKLKVSKTLSVDYASQSIGQVLLALKFLHHKKIVHRDIKPENVVISYGVRKLCDFGTAAICLNRRSTVCGTLDYTAPQLIEGHQYNEPLDLWSIGVMTYELLTGKPPFYHIRRKDTIKEIMKYRDGQIKYASELSEESVDFIGKFLVKDPQKRITIDKALKQKFIKLHADEQTKELTQKYMTEGL